MSDITKFIAISIAEARLKKERDALRPKLLQQAQLERLSSAGCARGSYESRKRCNIGAGDGRSTYSPASRGAHAGNGSSEHGALMPHRRVGCFHGESPALGELDSHNVDSCTDGQGLNLPGLALGVVHTRIGALSARGHQNQAVGAQTRHNHSRSLLPSSSSTHPSSLRVPKIVPPLTLWGAEQSPALLVVGSGARRDLWLDVGAGSRFRYKSSWTEYSSHGDAS